MSIPLSLNRIPTVRSLAPNPGQEFDSQWAVFFLDCRVFAESLCRVQSRPPSPSSKMYAQRLTQRHAVAAYRVASRAQQLRRLASAPPPAPPPKTPQPAPPSKSYRYEKAEPERSWVVQKIRANSTALNFVRALGRAMGYGSTKQVAGRRTLAMYEQVCAIKASEDRVFWQGERDPSECGLSPMS
jgi:hypothetical protein